MGALRLSVLLHQSEFLPVIVFAQRDQQQVLVDSTLMTCGQFNAVSFLIVHFILLALPTVDVTRVTLEILIYSPNQLRTINYSLQQLRLHHRLLVNVSQQHVQLIRLKALSLTVNVRMDSVGQFHGTLTPKLGLQLVRL